MGFLRDLCVSIAACLFVLPVVWPAPAEPPELLAATHATGPALEEPGTDFSSQPAELPVIGPVEEETVGPKGHQAADAALVAAAEMETPDEVAQAAPLRPAGPTLLAATDATGPELQEPGTDFSSQPAELSVIAPIEEEAVGPTKGHQAADAALMAAVEMETPDEMAEAAPLKPPAPTLFAHINLTTQRLTVSDKSGVLHTWKISSARGGYVTPVGVYKPQWTSRMHYSKQYYNSPMPYSVFFHRGYAVHGTSAVGRLGRPASHGCVRLRTSNAKKFYNLVNTHGKGLTKITVRGTRPASASPRVRDYRPRRRYRARARRPRYRPSGLFSAYSYRQPRRRRYRRRRYSRY
ncbi:MAG: L,D-transpeptidase family protein [Hyphomicrobium sp.]